MFKIFLQLFAFLITICKNYGLKFTLLLVKIINFINNLEKNNPTLFNLIKGLSGVLGGLLAYKLSKLAIKIDLVRWFDIFINLITLGYVINLSESFRLFTEQLLDQIKHFDSVLLGLFNS